MTNQPLSVKTERAIFAVLLLLTAVLVVSYRYLPDKQRDLVPGAQIGYFLYDDSSEGGGNRALWVNEPNKHWRCHRNSTLPSKFCGFNIALSADYEQGVDISDYETITMEVDIPNAIPQVTVFLRNFNPAYSKVEDGNSTQYIHYTLLPADYSSTITIKLTEMALADWWVSQRSLERRYRQPEFNNIVLFGINMGGDLPAGDNDMVLKRIYLSAPRLSEENWYLSIILVWLVGGFLYLMSKVLTHKQQTSTALMRYQSLARRHESLHQQAQSLSEKSRRDELSGLFNRHGVQQAMAELQESGIQSGCLLLVDIDHFKRINDKRGHQEGDRVIRQMSAVLNDNTRVEDIVARWGGEEFLLVCPAIELPEAVLIAEKIRQKVFSKEFFKDRPMPVSVSVGVAKLDLQEGLDRAFERADQGLYRAKTMGRNCIVSQDEL